MAQEGKVTIAPDEMGNVIRVSQKNPEYGHVRLVQETVGYTVNGWVKKQSRSTLLHGTVEDLKSVGIQDMTELPGQIVIRESVEAFSTDDSDRDLKIAGDTGIVCCKLNHDTGEEQPIYRRSFYDPTNAQTDELVPHTNSDAIREANGAEVMTRLKAATATTEVEDESMIDGESTEEEIKVEPDEEDVDADDKVDTEGLEFEEPEEEVVVEEVEEVEVEDENSETFKL